MGMAVMGYVGGVLLPKQLVTMTRAASNGKPSPSNSIMIGTKILAESGGDDSCKVNVFVADKDNRPLMDANVVLTGAEDVEPKQIKTNEDGKAVFSIKSINPGIYKLSATVDGMAIKSGLTVMFE